MILLALSWDATAPEAAVAAYLRGIEATRSAPPLVQQLATLREKNGKHR